ncbi:MULTISPECIES: exopolysaccharide production protein YjbE [Pantoea]|jgi:hypothetical protein|uniref:exopolysaccharide production protein YjbE n=1 Tax=Pantoea TaxID=53335 RepID=UPI00351A0F0E
MRNSLIVVFLMAVVVSKNAIAEDVNSKDRAAYIQNNGVAAGDAATAYAVGSSLAIGISAISVLTGVALATLNAGGSNTSTTTTTSTIPGK